MGKIDFHSNSEPTLGIELELGLIDAETLALSNSIGPLLERLPVDDAGCFKPELMQSCLEVNTCVCHTVAEAERDLRDKLRVIEQAAESLNLRIWWGATHPFSCWRDQLVTPDDRYYQLVNLLQEMARRLVTFGLHIHVGVDTGDKAVMICDRIMRHLPTLLAISSSSPFWEGRDTGLHSHRSKIMEGLPTAGLPTLMRNWSEYVWLVNQMVETGFINTIREIWWDVRPHHNFGTVEVRVCDMPGNLAGALGLAALVQCLVKALSDDIDQGAYQHDCHPVMVRQNKWRACRYGIHADLVDSFTHKVKPVAAVVEDLIGTLQPVAQELDCAAYLQHCLQMAHGPSAADDQAAILAASGDPADIVREMIDRSRVGPNDTPTEPDRR
jgi:carboxylate-amine ligase